MVIKLVYLISFICLVFISFDQEFLLFRIYRDDIAGVLLDWRQARGLDKVIIFTKKMPAKKYNIPVLI